MVALHHAKLLCPVWSMMAASSAPFFFASVIRGGVLAYGSAAPRGCAAQIDTASSSLVFEETHFQNLELLTSGIATFIDFTECFSENCKKFCKVGNGGTAFCVSFRGGRHHVTNVGVASLGPSAFLATDISAFDFGSPTRLAIDGVYFSGC